MPFTFAHPAIVLPLAILPRRWFSWTGLVVGSMTPDFEYFLRMRVQSHYSHTLSGLFWFDLPLGFILAYWFHHLVRDCLFDHLPLQLKARLMAFRQFDWSGHCKKNGWVVAVSLLTGAASHIFWDGFTHEQGYFVHAFPTLATSVKVWGFSMPVFKILQHASTAIGGLAVAYAIYQLPLYPAAAANSRLKYWSLVTALTLSILILRIFAGLSLASYGALIATVIAAGCIALTLTPLLMRNAA